MGVQWLALCKEQPLTRKRYLLRQYDPFVTFKLTRLLIHNIFVWIQFPLIVAVTEIEVPLCKF